LKEVKKEQETLETQNTELQDEVRMLRGQVSALSASLSSTQSWTSVASNANTAQATSQTLENPQRPTSRPPIQKELSRVRISTARQEDNMIEGDCFTRYLSTEAAKRRIQDALRQSETTKEIKVVGVGTTETGYVIRFRDEHKAEKVKANPEWLQQLGNSIKLVKPRFKVVTRRFPIEGIHLEDDKQQVIDKIMEDNDKPSRNFKIDDVRWLKAEDKAVGVARPWESGSTQRKPRNGLDERLGL
jgi:hypothetical protein